MNTSCPHNSILILFPGMVSKGTQALTLTADSGVEGRTIAGGSGKDK